MRSRLLAGLVAVSLAGAVAGLLIRRDDPPRSFVEQACALPREWLELTQRGYNETRSGHISLLPRTPAYMASGGQGWSHSGPWPYLQDVPLVFYGPGVVPARGDVEREATLADVAPTLATLLKGAVPSEDGTSLDEVATLEDAIRADDLKVIVTIVWDGGGWNTLRRWPDAWPNLRALMDQGVSFTNATVGSSPSVTPAVHSTLGTGVFPRAHGVTGVPVRNEAGKVVDAFLNGRSSRFLQVKTLAERWDEGNDNRALIGMVGYEPWHLGMIGKGAEEPGGDRDHAVWLDRDTNEWITNEEHYALPPAIPATDGLEDDLAAADALDGRIDGRWRRVPLDDVTRIEETPGFVAYHARALIAMMDAEGYGADDVTDLVYTNFKGIDRIGHYYNMASEEVRDNLAATDDALGTIVDFLDRSFGEESYVVVVTADHGQQPDEEDVDGYGIDPREVKRDVDARFGAVTRAVWPTEVFLLEDEMQRLGVSVEDVAEFLGDYRLRDNATTPAHETVGSGRFSPSDRLFAMAIPAALLPDLDCSPR